MKPFSRFGAAQFRAVLGSSLALVIVPSLILLASWMATPAQAEEGMWLLNALDKSPYARWAKNGLELSKQQLFDPNGADISDAVVQVGGGTGAFVSKDGLIVTNHHVAFGALQRQSSVKTNYLEDGFYARARGEEIPALGYDAYVLESVKDVTGKVLRSVKSGMTDRERYDAIEAAIKHIVKRAEKGKDIDANVKSFYGGSQYYLYTNFKIKDVRIVYAPPGAIGVYGGEVDNWMWPRHTGDFSFLRAYVSPGGKSAEYDENNVPYRPRKHLVFSAAPLREGDLTMVIGYPGRTERYRSSYWVDYVVHSYYPKAIKRSGDLIDILESVSEKNPDAAIKLASTIRSLGNSHKNNEGMLEGLVAYNLIHKKEDEEQHLRKFIVNHSEVGEENTNLFDDLTAQYRSHANYADVSNSTRWMLYMAGTLRSAYTIYNWSHEGTKSDADRDESFMPRDESRLKKRIELAGLRFDETADKEVLRYFLRDLHDLSGGDDLNMVRHAIDSGGGNGADDSIDRFIDKLYADTKITDKNTRLEMFDMQERKLLAMGDPFIEFAKAVELDMEALEEKDEAFAGAMKNLRPKLIALRAKMTGEALYPDANFSMRLSVGEVRGYSPRDAVQYAYYTSLSGVTEKHTGEAPFNCPPKLARLCQEKDYGNYADPMLNDVPVCFLSTNDVTGGNSGSAILNGRGEVIGLVFDGNYEAISADYQFMESLTRTINVDSRYILFVLDKFSNADELLAELTIEWGAESSMR